jgi:hypothetical protein
VCELLSTPCRTVMMSDITQVSMFQFIFVSIRWHIIRQNWSFWYGREEILKSVWQSMAAWDPWVNCLWPNEVPVKLFKPRRKNWHCFWQLQLQSCVRLAYTRKWILSWTPKSGVSNPLLIMRGRSFATTRKSFKSIMLTGWDEQSDNSRS